MRRCCSQCFGDRGLRKIIQYESQERGECGYCGASDTWLVDPRVLVDHFELLVAVYVPREGGKPLVTWFREDWGLFTSETMNDVRAGELLADILDDRDVVRGTYVPSVESDIDRVVEWQALKHELMHRNRYFPSARLDLSLLGKALTALVVSSEDLSLTWYRARIEVSGESFAATEMGAPPPRKASHGRANPAGIPYLYLGSTAHTAVSEIRPHTGERASIAEFTIRNGLRIVDLREPRVTVSPFPPIFENEEDIGSLRNEIAFLQKLGEELTRPVFPQAAAIDYIPTQYLCEFIKQCGYAGVSYRSSVSAGFNLALFDPDIAVVGTVSSHTVSRVSVEIT